MNNISSFVKPNFSCTCRPGGIAELTRIISNVGVSIKDIVHERAWVRKATFSVGVSEYMTSAQLCYYYVLLLGEDPGWDEEQEAQQGALQVAQGELWGERNS